MNMTALINRGPIAAAIVATLLGACTGPGSQPTSSPGPTATPEATAEPTPSPASAPSLTQSFTSTQHGISVSYPEGWTAQAATESWTESTFPLSFPGPQVDWLFDPTLTSELFLAIASQPIGDTTPEDWVAEQMASEEGCAATEPIAVDGASGLIGAHGCSVAVVTTTARGYWIQLYTGSGAPVIDALAWLEEVLATVQLQPEDADD